MRSSIIITLAVSLLLPVVAIAQSFGGLGDTGTTFTISATPQYPAPYSNTVLSFVSSSIDLANAVLSVSVDGKKVYTGAVQPVAITLGSSGDVTKVVATISSGGSNYSQSISVQPQDVVLVAEPISSSPTLYRGKPFIPLEGSVRVVAMANLKNASGNALNPKSLAYSWIVDGTRIANSSGIGKEAIIVASPLQYRSRSISVSVMSSDGSLVGGAEMEFSPLEPSVRIYENDPLLGIRYDHALLGEYAISDESTLFAAPFSIPTSNGNPVIRWFLNGAQAQTGNSITLRPTGTGQGNASLSLVASAGNYTTATTNLSLSFGAKPNNFFGL